MKNKFKTMNHLKKINKLFLMVLFTTVSSFLLSQTTDIPVESSYSNVDKLNFALLFIAIILLIPIYYMSEIFGNVIVTSLKEKFKNSLNTIAILVINLLAINSIFAQTDNVTSVASASVIDSFNIGTWGLLFVICVEILVLIFYAKMTIKLITQTNPAEVIEQLENKWTFGKWWKKSNNFIPFEEEDKLDTGHSYDGIRELDNGIPPWFSASFILCIIFAIVYLWNYHVAEISPLQIEEYTNEMEAAKLAQEKYLASQGSTLDENNIKLLAGAEIDEGKQLFAANCATCHAKDGGGGTGPNLTDMFWIHGGDANSIYKTIKYGVREKGMIPWKDNFNDIQILKIASFVNTLNGTKPAAPKAPQGDKYEAKAIPVDSTSTAAITPTDSTKK